MHAPKPIALVSLLLAGTLAAGCTENETAAPGAASTAPRPTAAPNGVERLPAAKIYERARQAALAASSMRMRGHVVDEGQKIELDFRYSGARASTGDMTVGAQRVNLTRIDSTLYLKGNVEFWREVGGRSTANLLSGKYFKTTDKDGELADLASFAEPAKVFSDLLEPEGELARGAAARIGGRAAIALEDGTGGRLYVATEGEPYVLRLDAAPDVMIDFSGYGEPVTIGPPPAGQVIDADELEG